MALHPIFADIIATIAPPARRYPITDGGHGKTLYGRWTIYFDPPPIPCRNMDWHYVHDNYDASYEGPEDGYVDNGLSGSCGSFADALNEIDEIEDEQPAPPPSTSPYMGEPEMPNTLAQIKKFIRIRNASGFSSNLQFSIDASEAGIDIDLLGDAVKSEGGGYEWQTPHGLLVERPDGQLELVA